MSGFWDPDRARDQAIDELRRRMDALEAQLHDLQAAHSESRDSPGTAAPDAGKAE